MLGKLTLYNGTVYRIGDKTQDSTDGLYSGRIVEELKIDSQMNESGSYPLNINVTIRNDDNFIPNTADLWAATLELTSSTGVKWTGKVNFFNFDADGNLYITASEKTAPELELQIPDEVRQVYTVDENFHQSSTTMTIPLVVGGTSSNPILLSTILIDKTEGVYLICVGEIRSIVKVYNGSEELPQTAYTAYTGTANQSEHAGFAYVQIADDYRLNSDGTYAEINVEVVGLKLGNYTEAECRNPARFLYYLLTTAATGVNGWGCGIDSNDIDTASFNTAITLCDTLNYKLDGIMWLRQSAQSWIDQICQTMHASYSIGNNGKRTLFIDYAGAASKKTFTDNDCQVSRYGKNSYNSVVYNKGVLSYGYNPVTGLFMQSAQYENADSIAQIGEQKFVGESYLINDAATALAVLEYTCKRSLSAAEAIDFETDRVDTILKAGDLITLNFESRNINGVFQIANISSSEYKSSISAVKFDTSVFVVGGSQSNVNWGNEKSITPALTPAMATSLNLSTGFDINPDGTGTPYISGTFTVPEGGWLAAAVQYGIGADPTNWTEMALITEGRFKLSPVNVGTVYAIRVRMITATGHSDYLKNVITSTGDTTPPSEPTISAKATDKTVTVQCGLDNPPYDMGGFQIYRKKSTEQVYTLIGSVAANRGYAAFSDYVDEYVTYNYKAKSYDRSGNLSTQFSDVANVTITGVEAVELAASAIAMPTGSILRLSAKNCTTASIAEVNGVKDCSGYGHHGRAYGGVAVLDGGEGFSFDGTNDYILCSNILDGKQSFTFCVNFVIKGVGTSNSRLINVFSNQNGYKGFSLFFSKELDLITSQFFSSTNNYAVSQNYNFELNKKYHASLVFDHNNHILAIYVNAEKIIEQEVLGDLVFHSGEKMYFGCFSSITQMFNGNMSDIRIYPRALSATEIKSIFMIPDETVFAQLTTDMFGANIIHANYILNDGDFQTLAVNAVNANINNLNVAGNATFTGLSNKVTAKYGTCSTAAATAAKVVTLSNFSLFTGAQISVKFTYTNSVANPTLNVNSTGAKTIRAKGANLTASSLYNWVAGDVVDFVYDGTYWVISDISAKDYSNTELAKKMSIASYCSSSDTTKIDGANIYAGSVTALQMAANSITAQKLNITALDSPQDLLVKLSAIGLTNSMMTDGSYIPDSSGNGKYGVVTGVSIDNNTLMQGKVFSFSGTNSYISLPTNLKTTTNRGWTVHFKLYYTDNPNTYNYFFDVLTASTLRIGLYVKNTGVLGLTYDGDTDTSVTLAKNTVYDIILDINANRASNLFVDGTKVLNKTISTGQPKITSAAKIGARNTGANGLVCQISCFEIFDNGYSTEDYARRIMMASSNESGQITADRIATDAIKSRNYAYSSGLYSTAGTFLDLANGQIISKNFSIDSSGNATFKGALSGATGSFSGSVTATSGKIGRLTISSNGDLTYDGTSSTLDSSYLKFKDNNHYVKMGSNDISLVSVSSYSTVITPGVITVDNGSTGTDNRTFQVNTYGTHSSDIDALILGLTRNTAKYAMYLQGKLKVNSTEYTSDESTKKDFQDVSTLDKLKKLRVCAWRFDEEKLIEKFNTKIDSLNAEIEAENKAIDAENAEIEKENEKRKNRKDGEPVELIPLKEHKKLREHRIADKNANHPLNIGCMAGEFNKAFGTNNGSEDCLSVTDTIGVCMRAIQELAEISDAQKAEIAELKAKLKIQQDEKSDIEQESLTTKENKVVETDDIEPSSDELLEDGENQQEEQK